MERDEKGGKCETTCYDNHQCVNWGIWGEVFRENDWYSGDEKMCTEAIDAVAALGVGRKWGFIAEVLTVSGWVAKGIAGYGNHG